MDCILSYESNKLVVAFQVPYTVDRREPEGNHFYGREEITTKGVNYSTEGMLETTLDVIYSTGEMLETTLNANYSTGGMQKTTQGTTYSTGDMLETTYNVNYSAGENAGNHSEC